MTEIKITGPGGVINYEYYVILKALKDAGIQVEEINDSPEESPEKHLEMIKSRIDTGFIKSPWQVKLIANHMPWGG